MEVLILCIVVALAVVWVRRKSNRDNAILDSVRQEDLDASNDWVKERLTNHQQIEMVCGPKPIALDSDESGDRCAARNAPA